MRLLARALANVIVVAGVAVLPLVSAYALNYGSGTYGSCQFNTCSLTISSNGTVNVNVTPTSGGACTIQSDTVGVTTDDSSGFNLTLQSSGVGSSLKYGTNLIAPTTGTQSSPIALTANRWGYRVDGVGGFGSGPTTAQSNISIPSTTFAAVPTTLGSADTLANTSAPANPTVNTTVWYGVCADTTVKSGTYTLVVNYTAVTN